MVNGVCPECGYQYPFAFECQFLKGVTCRVTKRLCNKAEKYTQCEVWHKNAI